MTPSETSSEKKTFKNRHFYDATGLIRDFVSFDLGGHVYKLKNAALHRLAARQSISGKPIHFMNVRILNNYNNQIMKHNIYI
jgi:hypothetical protein